MKVLFLTITMGQGHNATAQALMDYMLNKGADCRFLDAYEYIAPALRGAFDKGIVLTTKVTPGAYAALFRLAELRDKNDSSFSMGKIANSVLSVKLRRYLEDFKPDVIVCTHNLAAQLVDVLKDQGKLDATIIGIITDYMIQPFWEDLANMDYFVIASELLLHRARKKGLPEEKILPLGIPVHSKFNNKIDKREARRMLGIDEYKHTILYMSGGLGTGNLTKIIKRIDHLDGDFQTLCVCGRNKSAKRRIDRLSTRKKLYTYGFVDNVDVMMDAADCILTKPGGITISEALAKKLPIIIVNPIQGPEERNVEFLLNNGLAMYVTPTFTLDEALYEFFYYPERFENMQRNIQLIAKPHAARDIGDFIFGLA
jgi:processive 1,2-diacylglycerol beta-glucosyltransferase